VSGGMGVNDPGSYGSIGVSSPFNRPPGRMGSFAWQDANGNLWTGFGQTPINNSYRNDLWKFVPDPACGGCSLIPLALFSAPHHICPGTCTDFINLSQFATTFLWSFPGATPSTSVDANPTNICYNTPGSYSVTLIASNMNTSDTLTLTNYMTVYPYPAPQGILQSGDTLFANTGAISYQWYHDGLPVPGATNYFFIAPESGDYNVVATDINGCEVEAAIFDVIAEIHPTDGSSSLEIYPNPVGNSLTIEIRDVKIDGPVSIYNMLGEKTLFADGSNPSFKIIHSGDQITVDCQLLPPGMYWLELIIEGKSTRTRFIKTGNH